MGQCRAVTIVLLVVSGPPAFGQAPLEAEITYLLRGRKGPESNRVTIVAESPAGISYRLSGRIEKLAFPDIVDITYYPPSTVARQDIRRGQRFEDEVNKTTDPLARRDAIQQTIDSYRKLVPQLDEWRFAQRHAAFKAAYWTVRFAEVDPSQRDAALSALSAFLKEYGDGWQAVPASRSLAAFQIAGGDFAVAQKTYSNLASKNDLPREDRLGYEIRAARVMLDNGKYEESQKQLQAIKSRLLPEDDAARLKVDIYLIGCQGGLGHLDEATKQLQTILEGETALPLKALACSTLADCLRRAGQAENAFWRYLMVDMLYNQDPEEHARALYHLTRLFEQFKKDSARAQECRERLLHEKEFDGTVFRWLELNNAR
jgi:hypothetical protein